MSRKDVEEFIYSDMKKLSGTNRNTEMYKTFFSNMSDTQFDKWMKAIYAGEDKVHVTIPSNNKERVSIERITKMASSIGLEIFDYIVYDKGDEITQSPIKVCILELPCRRVSQLLDKGVSVSEHDKSTDLLTGQAIGKSKSASISSVEGDVMISTGVAAGARELLKARGGDIGAYRAYKSIMLATGEVNLDEVEKYETGVSSKKTLSIYLKGKMIGNNL